MDVIDTIKYLNSADGPNIPLRTLGAYCGISEPTLCNYLNEKINPRPSTVEQIKKGLREMLQEIWEEAGWLM